VHELSSGRRRLRANAGKLALTLGICVCAGQLMAGPALADAATTATPTTTASAQAAAAVAPKMAFGTSTRRLPWGSALRLSGRATDPATGKAVSGGRIQFQAWVNGRWASVGTFAVNSSGAASHVIRPYVGRTYRAVYYTGAATYKNAASGKVWVAVVNSRAKVVAEARKHLGARYRYGASGPRVFDCSGFTKYVYRKATGRVLPHKANSQQKYGKAVAN
jgi:cell wall-associated NlpC family hydrolase